MRRTVLPALAMALALTACGSDGGGDSSSSATSASESPEECIGYGCSNEQDAELNEGEAAANAPAEGPVTEGPYEWPDGVTARVVSVTTGPVQFSNAGPGEDTQVDVTVEFANGGTAPFQFPDGTLYVANQLYYGQNRYEAQSWAVAPSDLPKQLMPGTSATYTSVFTMPGSELGELAVTTSPSSDTHEPYTFTDVETLLD